MMWMILCALVFAVSAAPECKDLRGYCKDYKDRCQEPSLKSWLKKFCPKTCGYCGGHTPKPITTQPPTTVIPYHGKCGQPEIKGIDGVTRVVAGKDAVRGSSPWQILLSKQGQAECGGTIVAPNWVVTAAHCVFRWEDWPEVFSVRVGEHDRTKTEGSEVDMKVRTIFRHPNYSRYTYNNDIALLRLEKPVKFDKYVAAACLPTGKIPVGTHCVITGWGGRGEKLPGPTWVLQQGRLPVVSNKVCHEKNKHIIDVPITDAMICGGSGGTDPQSGCQGDSGGPLVCKVNGKWELHGAVSHGPPNCKSSEAYTVFSRTYHFVDWIKYKMRHY